MLLYSKSVKTYRVVHSAPATGRERFKQLAAYGRPVHRADGCQRAYRQDSVVKLLYTTPKQYKNMLIVEKYEI